MITDDEDEATKIVATYLRERSLARTSRITGVSPRRVRSLVGELVEGSRPGKRPSPEMREAMALAELYLDATGSAPWRSLAKRAGVHPHRLKEAVLRR